jgi:hypothetical protein
MKKILVIIVIAVSLLLSLTYVNAATMTDVEFKERVDGYFNDPAFAKLGEAVREKCNKLSSIDSVFFRKMVLESSGKAINIDPSEFCFQRAKREVTIYFNNFWMASSFDHEKKIKLYEMIPCVANLIYKKEEWDTKTGEVMVRIARDVTDLNVAAIYTPMSQLEIGSLPQFGFSKLRQLTDFSFDTILSISGGLCERYRDKKLK